MNNTSYGKVESPNKRTTTLTLLKEVFVWAREANPSQPVTSGVWNPTWADPDKLSDFEKVQLEESDIITFHDYGKASEARQCIVHLSRYHRPIICTEYMARPVGSTFDPVLGVFKAGHVGACNWGFVSGKTQTIYPWDSWTEHYTAEPPLWFHDILHPDGTPYRQAEVNYIRSLTTH